LRVHTAEYVQDLGRRHGTRCGRADSASASNQATLISGPVVEQLITLILFFEYLDAGASMLGSLFLLASASLLLMALPGLLLHRTVLRRLREDHPHTWKLLGEPSIVYYGSAATTRAVLRFFRHREYESLGDPSLASLCGFYRMFTSVYSGLFVVMITSFCLEWFAHG
jgi:hypothetical protein